MREKSLEDRKMCVDNGNMIQANIVEEKEEKRKNKKCGKNEQSNS